jgi:class 3 adenylate cyclase
VNIAYWTLGEGPTLLVLSLPTLSHLELEWAVPSFRTFYQALAERFTMVRYSTRNARLSDQDVEDLSIDAMSRDVLAVLDACSDGPVALLSFLVAAELSATVAARIPDRVSTMIHINGTPSDSSMAEVVISQITYDYDSFLENMVNLIDGGGDEHDQLLALIDGSIDRNDRLRMVQTFAEKWASEDLLSKVDVPTLVIYSQGKGGGPLEAAARKIASAIPNARLVGRPSNLVALRDTMNPDVATIIGDFIDESVGRTAAAAPPETRVAGLRIILFTDLESSTALTQAVGDDKAQEVLHGHNDVVRQALADHNGEEVKHLGDGIMAGFTSAVSAVQSAQQIQRDLAGGEVRVRIGLNAGEPIAENNDYFGSAVQLAARVCDRAEPGQILVPQVVRDLCRGKQIDFADQGEVTLKGFPEPIRLFLVTPPSGADPQPGP